MCNLGIFSQLSRIIFGFMLIALAWFGPQTSILEFEWMYLWRLGWLGLIPLISGIAAFCPIYAVLGFGHKPNEQKQIKDREK
jgi:Inner membrane protein YgaP-like, transmembrane domain